MNELEIDGKKIGPGNPVYVIAEIGINHNGDPELCRKLIDVANVSGCDAVKFQKRVPEKAVPRSQWDKLRETPWGEMKYIEYKKMIEFGEEEYTEIAEHCKRLELTWFASSWDLTSVEFLQDMGVPAHKIPSAALTDHDLLDAVHDTGKPVILSTGMSTMEEIEESVGRLDQENLVLLHCTSTYPAKAEELNLRMIDTLKERFDCPVGYSGHEVGLQTTLAAVARGACMVERHITLDRAMWGTDQAASVEPPGLMRLVRDIRVIEKAFGDGVKKVYEGEIPMREKLRKVGVPQNLVE